MISTVIFDLDGTLLDTLDDLKNSVRYVQAKYGYPLHERDEVRMHVGNGVPNLVAKSIPGERDNPHFEQILADYNAHYKIHSNDETKPYPGIMELLARMEEEGYKMSIVSNKTDFAVKDLNEIYFKDYVEVAIGQNEETGIRRKPYPDTVNEAMRLLGVGPEECVYIGDSEVDILTARNSGMPCILCEWGFRDKDDLIGQGGKMFAKDAMDILELVKKL